MVKNINIPKSKSVVVKVHSQPRKSRKVEKHNILVTCLRDAGKNNTFVTREFLAEKVGTTVGSINAMLSDHRKDPTIVIERSKQGYRIIENTKNVVNSEKIQTLTTMLREAGKCNVFITKEQAATKLGLIVTSIDNMISEISKIPNVTIEQTDRGYRIANK